MSEHPENEAPDGATLLGVPARATLIDQVTVHTCTRRCYGVPGGAASCCQLGERDYIIGPIRDTAEVLKRLSAHLGRPVAFDEVFISFDEGARLFPTKSSWQQEKNFPALRVNLADDRLPCRFLGAGGLCTIHTIRPEICAAYRCTHLSAVLDLL